MRYLGIDTIKIRINKKEIRSNWCLDDIRKKITEISNGYNKRYDYKFIRGQLDNLKIYGRDNYVQIEGSLPKYVFNNNLRVLNRDEIIESIDEISDLLELPVWKGYIKRIDIGGNVILTKDINKYLDCFDETPGYDKTKYKTGLLYKSINRTHSLVIYDKLKEVKKKYKQLDEVLDEQKRKRKKLLRFELQIQQKANRLLQYKSFRVVHLFSKTFMQKLYEIWNDKFESLCTKKNFDFSNTITSYEALEIELKALGILTFGIDKLYKLLDDSQKNDLITPSQKSYAKKKIKTILAKSGSLIELDAADEMREGLEFLMKGIASDEYEYFQSLILKHKSNYNQSEKSGKWIDYELSNGRTLRRFKEF